MSRSWQGARDSGPAGAFETGGVEISSPDRALQALSWSAQPVLRVSPVTERTLIDYLSVVWLHKGLLTAIIALGMLAGYLAGLPQTPLYRSSTLLEIQEPNEAFLNLRELEPTTASPRPGSYLNTQIQVLRSKLLRSRVAERLAQDTSSVHIQTSNSMNALMTRFRLPAISPQPTPRNAIQAANLSLNVRVVGESQLVEIFCDSTDPRVAANFVNGLVSEYIAHQLDSRSASSQQTSEWLDRQIDELRTRLHESEQALQSHARDSALMLAGGTSNLAEEQVRSLQQDLAAARSDLAIKKSQQQIAGSAPPESLPDVLNDSDLRVNQLKLTELRSQKAAMEATLTPEHYRVVALQNQITELERVVNNARNNILRRIGNEYESARLREGALQAAYARQVAIVANQQVSLAEYNLLRREADSNRSLLESLLQKVKTSRIAAGLRASNVNVLDAATPAARPHKPNVSRNVLTGFGVSLVFGVILIFVGSQYDRKLRAPGDVGEISCVPELGVVPSLGLGRRNALRDRHARLNGPLGLLGEGSDDKSVELTTWIRKPSPQAEAVRAVIASILARRERTRVLVVTSPHGGEGKTAISSNLAIALADTHRRVLLIDADLRQPRLHNIFDVPNTFGLSNLVSGKQDIRDIPAQPLASFVRETQVEGLFLLPSGPGSAHIARLLYSPKASELFRRLQDSFDIIVVDTPPALMLSDARVLARRSDGVVLVFRAGRTSMQAAQALLRLMEQDRTPVLGTILNDWKPKTHGYGSRYYGNHYYRSLDI